MTTRTRRTINELAAVQHGRVARWQLVDRGLTNGQIGAAVRRHRLDREAHGVYRVESVGDSLLGSVMRDLLRAGPGARAVGERLLAASGVRDARPDGDYAILVPVRRRLTGISVPVRADRWPAAGTPAVVQGIASYGIARNLLAAAVDAADDDRVAALADGVRRRSRHRMARVAGLVAAHGDHPGGRRLLRLGCLDTDAAESPNERLLEVLLADFDVRRQVRVAPRLRVDFLLEALGVVVEYDGSDHESGRARRRDEARDARIRALGYAVVHVTRADLRDPAALVARILLAATA